MEGVCKGFIVDLGERSDVMQEYAYSETVELPQGFSSIHVESGAIVILKDRSEGTFQPIRQASALFDDGARDHAKVHVGHIYPIRIKPDRDECPISLPS